MTIECYFSQCPKHATHEGEEGPFCFEKDCSATSAEIKIYEVFRAQEVKGQSPTQIINKE